jgi:hypothetical protein
MKVTLEMNWQDAKELLALLDRTFGVDSQLSREVYERIDYAIRCARPVEFRGSGGR